MEFKELCEVKRENGKYMNVCFIVYYCFVDNDLLIAFCRHTGSYNIFQR